MRTLWQDLRYGARRLLKKPGFTLIAVVTLALGIGANTAIFSVAQALLLSPLAGVTEPERLVQVGWKRGNAGFINGLRYPDYLDYRDQNTVFSGLAIRGGTALHLSTGSEAERVRGALVSGNYFAVLGVKASHGRTLLPADEAVSAANPVAVISHNLWQRRFGADPEIIGRMIRLNGNPFTVVGVTAEQFNGTFKGERTDVWLPLTTYAQANPTLKDAQGVLTSRGSHWLDDSFARLKPNVTLAQAQAEMDALARHLQQAYPETNKDVGVVLVRELGQSPQQRINTRNFTGLLIAVISLVLLIACANVANLLLACGSVRQKEIGIRLALGASRARLIRQLLIESVLLAVLGGLVGLLLALWLPAPLKSALPAELGSVLTDFSLDSGVLGFTLLLSLLTGLLFGSVPAWQLSKPDLVAVLKDKGASGQSARQTRVLGALVVGQIALSILVLIGAGLLVRTLQKTQLIQPGFETEPVLAATIDLGRQGYSETQGRAFYQHLLNRIEALPGVRSASLAQTVPFGGTNSTGIRAAGQADDAPPMLADINIVAPRYFETLGVPLLLGRDFNQADNASEPKVVIINEACARQLFPQENPLGKRLAVKRGRTEFGQPLEIIGVVSDVRYISLFEPARPHVYQTTLQRYASTLTLHVRADGNPSGLIAAVRREVQTLDRHLPIFNVRTLAEQLRNSLEIQRSAATFIGTFGLLALLLTSIGIYGVMAYAVTQRTHEIGIRMALGASRSDVLKMVLRQGMTLALCGVALGLAGAYVLTKYLESVTSMLYGVKPTDPLTFGVIAVLLTVVALMACYLPARRATQVDPMVALRYE